MVIFNENNVCVAVHMCVIASFQVNTSRYLHPCTLPFLHCTRVSLWDQQIMAALMCHFQILDYTRHHSFLFLSPPSLPLSFCLSLSLGLLTLGKVTCHVLGKVRPPCAGAWVAQN